jgi:hypothetical protein
MKVIEKVATGLSIASLVVGALFYVSRMNWIAESALAKSNENQTELLRMHNDLSIIKSEATETRTDVRWIKRHLETQKH